MVSRDLIELGEAVAEKLARECAAGEGVTHLQLIASPFYEALKREIGRTPLHEAVKIRALNAAAHQCRRAATCVVTPASIVVALRAAVMMLSI